MVLVELGISPGRPLSVSSVPLWSSMSRAEPVAPGTRHPGTCVSGRPRKEKRDLIPAGSRLYVVKSYAGYGDRALR